ncbi:MAG: IS200/IS605 family transposase [Acidimicrobiales bacterium]
MGGVGYRSTKKTVCSAEYHVIWCPEYRRQVLVGRVEVRLEEIIAEVVGEVGGQVIELEVMPDHVHLLVELPPTLWSPSWLVSTVGGAPLEVVRRYARNQEAAA